MAQRQLRVALLGASLIVSVVQAFAPLVSTAHKKRHNGILRLAAASSAVTLDDQKEVNAISESSPITAPRGSKNAWEVHKVGGASLADADLYRTCGDLLIEEAKGRGEGTIPTMAVVSARKGMTDLLVEVVETAIVDFDKAKNLLEEAVESQIALLKDLAPASITDPIEERFRKDANDVASVVQSLRMIQTVPAVTMEVVTGFGEIWSAQTLHAYLQTKGVPCDWIDAREILVVKSDSSGLGEKGEASTGGVLPLWDETESRLSGWWNTVGRERGFLDIDYSNSSPILVVTGFVATTAEGVPTTLKRSGSDYSATIFAKLTGAGRVTMWKNTDGVYTADPRSVPEAFSISSLKYDEAVELAYFGAQVLHPSAMVPCIDDGIPVYVRNIFNPAFEGTVIQGRCATLKDSLSDYKVKNWQAKHGEIPIKGITSVDRISLVTLEGASFIGAADAAERFMAAMADYGITVLIITQANSESSITVAVPEKEGKAALAALQDAFELELSRSRVHSISLVSGKSIVAIVGEGMALKSGVSATFMSSLARANVNIALIAQGSSERQIAVVVDANDTSRALRAAHMAFTLSETTASVTVLGGTGQIGSAFCRQIREQKEMLSDYLDLAVCVNIAACSTKMAICGNSRGLDTKELPKLLRSDEADDCDLDKITQAVEADVNPLRVIVDCTNSEQVADYYERWMAAGINIIGPSRKVPSGDLDRFHRVREAERERSVSWLFESSVASALPILTTLRDLRETGDQVHFITGCVSGTMAYVLSKMSDTLPFSEAVRRAIEKGFTENDVRDDLSGYDTVQKVVILARQLGLEVNIEDVEVESLIPDSILKKEYTGDKDEVNEAMLEDIRETVDPTMLERWKAAEAEDKNLRYKFVIDRAAGKCMCFFEEVTRKDPLFRLQKDENLVSFYTSRYETSPLIVKGAAAGPDLAAAGIFADLLRLTRFYSSLQG